MLEMLKASGKLPDGQFALGKSKVFLKNKAAQQMDTLREDAFLLVAIRIQKSVRAVVWKARFKSWKATLEAVRAAMANRSEPELTASMDLMNELPYGGKHIALYKDALALLNRLTEETKLVAMLEAAVKSRSKAAILSAVQAAKGMNPPYAPPSLADAESLVALIEKEEALTVGLRKACKDRDLKTIDELLSQAEEMNMGETEEVKQAEALKKRLEEEQSAVEGLNAAIASKDMASLSAFLKMCSEMGISSPEVKK
jgi:myosin heavy subunit